MQSFLDAWMVINSTMQNNQFEQVIKVAVNEIMSGCALLTGIIFGFYISEKFITNIAMALLRLKIFFILKDYLSAMRIRSILIRSGSHKFILKPREGESHEA